MRTQHGLTLIEVLIAVLVLAIGLLGIAGLQASALTNNFVGYQYTQAASLAQGMADRMHANKQGILDNMYALAAGTAPAPTLDCSANKCTPDQQAVWDMAVWYGAITGNAVSNAPVLTITDPVTSLPVPLLKSGAASITCADATCTTQSIRVITVYWDASGSLASNTTYSCDSSNDSALRCFSLALVP